MAGAGIAAGKAVGGGHRHARAAPAGFRAFGIGDPGHGARRLLGGGGALDQPLGRRLLGVDHVELGPGPHDLPGLGQAAIGIFRHRLGHRDGALDQRRDRAAGAVVGRDDRLALADQDAQAEIVALRALEFLDLAQPLGVRQRDAFEQHGVGVVGAGAARLGDELAEKVEGGILRHDGSSGRSAPLHGYMGCPRRRLQREDAARRAGLVEQMRAPVDDRHASSPCRPR